jgi:ATP-dependent DNA helicase RecG
MDFTLETQQTEYKKSFGKEVIISLVAFANTDGGRVIVGVDDNGTVCGIDVGPETVQRYLNEIKTATYPQLFPKSHIQEKDKHTILIFEINEFPIKPVSYKNRYYKRVHNSNHLLTLEEIVDLQQQSLSVSFDAYPVQVTLNELDQKLIKQFFDRVNNRGRITLRDDLLTNLIKLKLVRDEKVTLAANLLFGDPDFNIRVGRFKSAATIIDDNVIKAPLFSAIDEVMTFIKKHINLAYHFDGSLQRKERWQYPLEALRELLLNAVVHRDYKNFSDIIIKIFDDRILFTNPGRLYGNLILADLERDDYVSSLRNRLLAEAFYLTGDIERYGTGFVRIRDFLKDYPEVTLSVDEKGDFFRAELRINELPTTQVTPPVTPPAPPQLPPQLSEYCLFVKRILVEKKCKNNLASRIKSIFSNRI